MSHGIDICRCGAVVMQCRCIGPHTSRVVCETCDVCRSRHEPQTATPAPTTASAHQAMVEALRAVTGPHTINPQRGVYHLWSADCPRCNAEAKLRAALEGWEKRPRLRDQPALFHAVVAALVRTKDEGAAVSAIAILDALEPLLFGERG